jgi:hypothetical protein
MKKALTYLSVLLCFTFTTKAQKIGFKASIDKGTEYTNEEGVAVSSKWNSKTYGLSYEKPLSKKTLASLETGLYLNFKNNKKQDSYTDDYSNSDYFDNGSQIAIYNYNKIEKVREIHIPIFFKQYFYLGKAILFASCGPRFAFTLSDKVSYVTQDEGTISRENILSEEAPRLYLHNLNVVSVGYELKQLQVALALLPGKYATSNRVGPAWRTNTYTYSFSIGYMF